MPRQDPSAQSQTTSTEKVIIPTANAAQFVFTPPTPFDFKHPEHWDRWIGRFERYRIASGLAEQSSVRQATTLMYCLGEEAEDILAASTLNSDDRADYSKVKKLFADVFIGKRNVIYERAIFNLRNQKEGESFETFVTDLRKLAEHCKYGTLRDELIRDRIVVGIRDQQLSETLQLDADLTLEKAIAKCRQKEAVRRQQADLQNIATPQKIERIQGKKKSLPESPKRNSESNKKNQTCWFCGGPRHSRNDCPAKENQCYSCQKIGHYASVCHQKNAKRNDERKSKWKSSKQGSNAQVQEVSDNYAFLGAVKSEIPSDDFRVNIQVNGQPMSFKIDCGANVTIIPVNRFSRTQKLIPADRKLVGPGSTLLQVEGMFSANLSTSQRSSTEMIYVVHNQEEALLGKPAIRSLDLICVNQVNEIETFRVDIERKYPELFKGNGTLPGTYHIELEENAVPYSQKAPRNIPIPLRKKVEAELRRMERIGVIQRVVESTPWCAPIVTVPKSNGQVRICVDLTELNRYVKRPKITLPDVETTLGLIGTSKIFSKLDAQSGFWQIRLSEESAKLTTFITPFGRFYFVRLPFGISSAPEYFQLQMQEILTGLEGVVCHMDDILVHGSSLAEHNTRLHAVLERLKKSGLVLNAEKCVFATTQVKFLGHVIDGENVRIDPERTQALIKMPAPRDVSEIRRLLGMLNQISKFIPHLASKTQPIRELLRKDVTFQWGAEQQKSLHEIIQEIRKEMSLMRYDLNADVTLSADASQYGLGAMVTQCDSSGKVKIVSFASRTMSETKRHYAQIEKEALAITWACEKFEPFILGRSFKIETDHKPLVPLLSTRNLADIPSRIQRFKMRLMKYKFTIGHAPGTQLPTADCLSRAPMKANSISELTTEAEYYVNHVDSNYSPASPEMLLRIGKAQQKDDECSHIIRLLVKGWPKDIKQVPFAVRQWHPYRNEISTKRGVLCRGDSIIIPRLLRSEILNRIHDGHMGISRCTQRARGAVFWPGLTPELHRLIERCETCIKHQEERKYPMIASSTLEGPWHKIALDFLEFKKTRYLVFVDYYSRYIELARVQTLSTGELIARCREVFARHGIPYEVFSDSGTQFTGAEWQQFAKEYGFMSPRSSPHYHQSNGEAERAVKTVKRLLEKNPEDPALALLTYRATPNASGYSPAELLMGRQLRTRLPMLPSNLQPKVIDHDKIYAWDNNYRSRQAADYDQRHRTTPTPEIQAGTRVYIPDRKSEGIVVQSSEPLPPHTSLVAADDGSTLRRNSTMLRPLPDNPPSPAPTPSTPETSPSAARTSRYGRTIRTPQRLGL